MMASSLGQWRKKASFEVRALQNLMFTEEVVEFKNQVWDTLATDPLFSIPSKEQTLNEKRELSFKRTKRLVEYGFLGTDMMNPLKKMAVISALLPLDVGSVLSWQLSAEVFGGCLLGSGTTRKHRKFYEDCSNMKEFVLHTPDIEAVKCWSGNLGTTATHAIVLAQLYTPDGMCHGLHSFVVPIRDPHTHEAYPGLVLGDMMAKIGQNTVSNGFLKFNQYRIPHENLLNKGGDVTPEGTYVSPYKDPKKHYGATLGALSAGRVGICDLANTFLASAVTVAIRYSAVRRQFGPTPDVEVPVLDYQLQQWRLLPYLAALFVHTHFTTTFMDDFVVFFAGVVMGEKSKRHTQLGREIHAISCAMKPLCGFIARDGIQECREACGGHGYLAVSGLGMLRDNNDPNLTYEGDNNVILQQTANYLMTCFTELQEGKVISSPLGSVDILNDYQSILQRRFSSTKKILTCREALAAYEWLFCYLWVQSKNKLDREVTSGKGSFFAKEDSMVYHSHTLGLVYMEHLAIKKFCAFIEEAPAHQGLKSVLGCLGNLYSLWRLNNHVGLLYQGGYFARPQDVSVLKDSILEWCTQVRGEAVALVDVMAPPDHILGSPIGHSNGKVYENLYEAFVECPGATDKCSYWQEVVDIAALQPGSKRNLVAKPRAKL